ncbi:oligosaccharide flippase family protein [Mucilaginibacter sp. CAU 1740]|uniref:lipopolysaccharide biosynthesis protein n=1 Tax=Mucilaginibacter sp. CAU 1740 TaxID=3140365 RepID=UPI00325B371F
MKKKDNLGVLLLYVSTIVGLGFSFLGSIINSKMLSKESFGDFKYIQSYLLLVNSIINFGFFQSGSRMIAASDDDKKNRTIKGYLIYLCLMGLVIMFVITLITRLFGTRVLSDRIFHYMLLFFPLFLAHPLMNYFESVFQAERKLVSYSMYKMIPPIAYILCLLAGRNFFSGVISYNIITYYSCFLLTFIVFIVTDKIEYKGRTPVLTELLELNKEFGLQMYYGSLWGVGTGYMLTILIGYFNVNNVDVGRYSLAYTFVTLLTFLPTIFGTANFKYFINADRLPRKVLAQAIGSSLILLLFLVFTIDFWIGLFLNKSFVIVGLLVKIGAITAVLHGFGDFINKFLIAKGKGKIIKNAAIITGVIQLIAAFIFIPLYSAVGAMIANAIGSGAYFLIFLIYYYKNYEYKREPAVDWKA